MTDFNLSVNPGSVTLTPGASGQAVQVSASTQSGTKGPVSVSISNLPAGVTAAPSTLTLGSGTSQSITLTAASSVETGIMAATLLATSQGQTLTAQIALNISDQGTGSSTVSGAPRSPTALTGCTNPNMGVSNGDWGQAVRFQYIQILRRWVLERLYTRQIRFFGLPEKTGPANRSW